MAESGKFAAKLETIGIEEHAIEVVLSNELIELLSGQLYKSPLKAIEELVVNSYDAGAEECFLYVPSASEQLRNISTSFISVFDNGSGMDLKGLTTLWRIGKSGKVDINIEKAKKRKLIGKFGIGKLATHTIAHRLTYISKTSTGIYAVTTDYRRFSSGGNAASTPVQLPVRKFTDETSLLNDSDLSRIIKTSQIPAAQFGKPTWTFAILEELKDKANSIQLGRLRRVLETAMPLEAGFALYLNGQAVESSKEDLVKVVDFSVSQLSAERLASLAKATGQKWKVQDDRLVSELFKEGISGRVFVTDKSLLGKSDDLFRSHGFFIRVRGRLINEDDPNFGITSAYGTMNRFRADLNVDDLNSILTASREGIEDSPISTALRQLISEVFNEARQRYEEDQDDKKKVETRKNETQRNYVSPRYVEFPIADAIAAPGAERTGAEADRSWFYLTVPSLTEYPDLLQRLYQQPRTKYSYIYSQGGKSERLVRFDPLKAVFIINTDHEFARAHHDEPRAKLLLEDFVTTEAMLEVYLREASVPPAIIGEVLERRDSLMRSLALDHPYSLAGLAAAILDSASNERDLEVNLVTAARALGFVAKHISGEGEPDGVAEFVDYPSGSTVITLEAKSSKAVPSLGAIDFAGLSQHKRDHNAQGCLLVAPDYPGQSREEDSAASKRASELKISCWTVEQLSNFVKVAESRHLTARHLLDIVLHKYAPADVTSALAQMFSTTNWDMPSLYVAIVNAFRELEGRLNDAPRNVSAIATEVSRSADFRTIRQEQVKSALIALAEASKGAMTVREETIQIHVSTAELERRVAALTAQVGESRRGSNFREGPDRPKP